MKKIKAVVKQTLINLDKQNIAPTPKAYTKEYCKVAKEVHLTISECETFTNIVKRLSKNEQIEVKEQGAETLEDVIAILLNRVSSDDIANISELLQESLKPSISLSLDEDLHKFSIKIGDKPNLIFEEEIQKEMQKFISQRINLDQIELEKKAKEITTLMTQMTKSLGDIIDSNAKGTTSISAIADEIGSIDATNPKNIQQMQEKLVNAANSIKEEMSKSTETLKSGQDEVQSLQSKVEELEKKLQSVKKESDTDHLTGLLTRRAYDRESQKFEDNYKRYDHDYAVIFFDIDHFKKVNDTYGHDAGDAVLKTFAQIILKSTRDGDIVGRYGGEEFVGVVKYRNAKDIQMYIKRIKSIVTGHKFKYKDLRIPITFSAGVNLRTLANSYEETLKGADTLVYKAKNTGRNKIVFHDGVEL